jgi:hypothetical protein
MTERDLKSRTREGFERMFNSGDLEYVDDAVAVGAIDHQEPEGTDMAGHLKQVIETLRTHFLICTSSSTKCSARATSSRAARR